MKETNILITMICVFEVNAVWKVQDRFLIFQAFKYSNEMYVKL
jgi:hypothetical protein